MNVQIPCILALDLGSNCGWAFGSQTGTLLMHGDKSFKEKGTFVNESFSKFRSFVKCHLQYTGDLIVAVEKPHAGSFYHATRVLFGMLGILQGMVNEGNLLVVSPTTIKKFWTGKGNAKKEDMVRESEKVQNGTKPITHNEADAIALYFYAVEQMKGDK